MTGLSDNATNISTRIARGGDLCVSTGRSGWSSGTVSPRWQPVTIHRVTETESERTTPAKSTTWPSLTTNFAATQHDSLVTLLRDPATKDLARRKRPPALKDV